MAWQYKAPLELSDEQYARWQTLLEARTGICFLQHKSIMQKGLSTRMKEIGCDDYEQYFDQVSDVPGGVVEWTILVDRISVKETSFFREPLSFEAVRKFLRERIKTASNKQDYTLDIWSVGCSTGEEAYSLAMIASEVIDELSVKLFLGVMATDISKTAIEAAKRGIYSSRKLDGIPLDIKSKYFLDRSDGSFEILPDLKEKLCFVQGNIAELDRAPKMAMDIIFCQNVLVYFRKERHEQVLNALVSRLKPGGLLVVGPGEVVGWQHPQMWRSDNDSVLAFVKH